MASEKFIPELHDIGKLMSEELKEQLFKQFKIPKNAHTLINEVSDFIIPSSPSWISQYHHIKRAQSGKWNEKRGLSIVSLSLQDWNFCSLHDNDRRNLFLLILSDHLASSFRVKDREVAEKSEKSSIDADVSTESTKEQSKEFIKLWNLGGVFKNKPILFDDLDKVLQEIETCQSSEVFFNRYEDSLKIIPEDKNFPRNVTSLYTHVMLVGKFFRVFDKVVETQLVRNEGGVIEVNYLGQKVATIRQAEGSSVFKSDAPSEDIREGKWRAKFLKCKITFPHSFVRLQDINLLRQQTELVERLQRDYSDEVLFATSNFFMLFLPITHEDKERKIFQPFIEAGFHVEVIEIEADLWMLTSMADQWRSQAKRDTPNQAALDKCAAMEKRHSTVRLIHWPKAADMPEILAPPLCDICLQEPGIERIEGQTELQRNIREWIGEKCQEVRKLGEPFREYGNEWEPEGGKVCWFKFSLDQEKLLIWLENAFARYIGDPDKKSLDEFRPIALQMDFNADYREMLQRFWQHFGSRKEMKQPIDKYPELGVFKYSSERIQEVIEHYEALFAAPFPDCASGKDAPINLTVSIANIKYPIRDHWKYFDRAEKSWLNLRYHGVFEDAYTRQETRDIREVITEHQVRKSFLYNLIAIHERLNSEVALKMEIFNKRKEHHHLYRLLTSGIQPARFLNYYRAVYGEELRNGKRA